MHIKRGTRLALVATAALAFAATPAVAGFTAESEPNDTLATAQNLDPFFDLSADAEVTNSTTVPHADVRAGSAEQATYDWYSFTVAAAGTPGLFDIDHGMPNVDAWLTLFDSGGIQLATQDDGFAFDPGSEGDIPGWDPFLNYTFASAGTYFVRVGECCNDLPIDGSYVLHVSLGSPVPEPATWAMMLLGFGAAGFALRRSRKTIPALA
jgi:PEP-CTERM motif-containing protein/pre-peptidase